MAKRERLHLQGGMTVETGLDWNGRWFIGCRRGCSQYFRDSGVLRKFLALPPKTASREAFDSWIASLEAADTARKAPEPEPSKELMATGFGPECHLDESDPNHATRTII